MLKNTLVPINRLPPEILSNVLEHRGCDWDLVAATHVCKHWRILLISSPTLWARLQLNRDEDGRRIRTYLERSKWVARIVIEMDLVWFTPGNVLLELIIPHVGRVGSLTIHGPIADVQAVLFRVFCKPAPSLQHLVITVWLGCGAERKKKHRLPDNFLGRSAPALRSITLNGICPAFVSRFSLPDLTRFQSDVECYGGPIRASTICRILSISSQLKEVSIDLRPTLVIEDLVPDSVLSLDSLEELKFSGVLGAQVLPCLRLPRLRELQVTSVGAKIVNFLPVDGHLLLSKATNLSYCCIEEKESRGAVFSGDGVTIQIQGYRIEPANWLSDTSDSFRRVRHLNYSGFDDWVPPTIELPTVAFESLEILQFNKCTAGFVNAIPRLLSKRGIPCPSLQEIRCDSRKTLGSVARFVKSREKVGGRIRLVYCSDVGTLEEVCAE